MKLLVIEDNSDIVANLYEFLEPRGYLLDHARTGHEGLRRAAAERFDAIILDVMLPGMNGFALCHQLRQQFRRETPVLMLTAPDTIDDKLEGFGSGADDYLVKPFSMAELEARLKALLRRRPGIADNARLLVGKLSFDMETFEVRRDEKPLVLTPTGYKLLACLMRAAPRVVNREELERAVWGDEPPDSDALRTHLHAFARQSISPSLRRCSRPSQGSVTVSSRTNDRVLDVAPAGGSHLYPADRGRL